MSVEKTSFRALFFSSLYQQRKRSKSLKNLPHPNPETDIQTFEKQTIIQNLTEDKLLSKSNESQQS